MSTATYTQASRRLCLQTPLGEDALLLISFSGQEEMSRLFSYQLSLASTDDSIAPKNIVGKRVTFSVEFEDGTPRHFNGFVSRFAYLGTDDRLSRYCLQVVPWLWFLTRSSDCRIFQDKTIPDILEQVFKDLGFNDFDLCLGGSHPTLDYCVQYRETDFDFVSRLMEKEGIFYFFRHENGKHTLVLADSRRAYRDCHDKQASFASNLSGPSPADNITQWEHQYEYRTGKWAQTDYNFEAPNANLMNQVRSLVKLDKVETFEFYDYPGGFAKHADGDALTRVRMEEEETGHELVRGASFCRSFSPGHKFKLAKHHCKGEAGKGYVITSVRHSASVGETYVSGGGEPGYYSNSFTCIPDSIVFRPARITPKPVVHAQTAVVVGPAGEEIHTDKYGRVKVQFHWDRVGKKDDKSSCWMRVVQPWAGKQWGSLFLPRVGHEVLVSFLEGDPDRPLITGSVYNADNMPPYELPANKTISTIKSLSSKGGGGFNEIRFEDKKGSEQVFIHAEKDHHTRVKHDCFEWVGHERHLIVKEDDHEQVDGDKHLTVKGDQNEKITGTVSLNVGSDLQQKVAMNHALEAGQEIHLKAGMKVVIEAGMQLTIKAAGGFVDIGPAGVTIQGTLVKINSGGAAGSGSGCAPDAPKVSKEAAKAQPGQKSTPPKPPPPVKPTKFSPAATVLKEAAKRGTPFCEKCEAAKKAGKK